jgi:succinate dehydrogenase / fumarate reductase flavoprotein subunit
MGGVPTNYHAEVLRPTAENPDAIMEGLMAVGEAACVSVHGANRLGTNSLLDLVVFGRAAALRATATLKPGAPVRPVPQEATDRALERLDRVRNANGGTPTSAIRINMQRIMQNNCAVFRTSKVLSEGKELIDKAAASMSDLKVNDKSMIWNSDLVEALELDNLMGQALVSMYSAEARHESRGAHAHEDYPKRDDVNWMKHTLAYRDAAGKISLKYRPVHMYTLTDEIEVIPPKERVY